MRTVIFYTSLPIRSMALGLLESYIIGSSLVGVVLLFLSAALGLRYTHTFYGDRPVPRSWMLILLGLLANAAAEAGQLGVFGEAVFQHAIPGIPEGMVELAAHSVAGIALAAGAYMLYKEIP